MNGVAKAARSKAMAEAAKIARATRDGYTRNSDGWHAADTVRLRLLAEQDQ